MARRLSDFDRAIKAASKRIPILGNKALNSNLAWACVDMAEAYRCGAEETQRTIVARLRALGNQKPGALK